MFRACLLSPGSNPSSLVLWLTSAQSVKTVIKRNHDNEHYHFPRIIKQQSLACIHPHIRHKSLSTETRPNMSPRNCDNISICMQIFHTNLSHSSQPLPPPTPHNSRSKEGVGTVVWEKVHFTTHTQSRLSKYHHPRHTLGNSNSGFALIIELPSTSNPILRYPKRKHQKRKC